MAQRVKNLPANAGERGFPSGSDSKESACNAGGPGSVPGSGRSPEKRMAYLLQYSCLENSMERGAWWDTVRRVAESQLWRCTGTLQWYGRGLAITRVSSLHPETVNSWRRCSAQPPLQKPTVDVTVQLSLRPHAPRFRVPSPPFWLGHLWSSLQSP